MAYYEYENTLLAYEEDIKNRTFREWIVAHTSFLKPLYRYQGTLRVDEEALVFDGKNKNGYIDFNMTILVKDITDVFFGYDDVFRRREDRSLGLGNFKPLRIRFENKRGEQTFYVFAKFHWIRTSQNQDLYDVLESYTNSSE